MPYENLNNGELVDRLVEVTLEMDRLQAMKAEVHRGVLQDMGEAPDVDRSVDRESVETIRRGPELDSLHIQLDTEVRARGLHNDYLRALEDARKRG